MEQSVSEKLKTFEEVAEEIITREELASLLAEKEHPLAYDGFEPSGLAHLPLLYRAITVKKLLTTGVRFKFFLADWHAWLNGKLGGNLEAIRDTGRYFVEVWRAAGVPVNTEQVQIVWASDILDQDYLTLMLRVANLTTVSRASRALPIMGRNEVEGGKLAYLMYPLMQVTDIFVLGVDICQLGMDQRKANMLAREVANKLGFKKPVGVHHHILTGLEGLKKDQVGREEDLMIQSKMSKSKPKSTIFLNDSPESVRDKIMRAACPPAQVENNPVLEYNKFILFPTFEKIQVSRSAQHGGDVFYGSYQELERDYLSGKLHPLDLKEATAKYLNLAIDPIRRHFEQNSHARELLERVRLASAGTRRASCW